MHDRFLDTLSDYLIRLSRVPGLGFLERHASEATCFKHEIKDRLGRAVGREQGFEEGFGVLQDIFGRKEKEPSAPKASESRHAAETVTGTTETAVESAAVESAAVVEDQPPAPSTVLQTKVAQSKPLRKPAAKSTDAQLKQKLLMKTIKRQR